MTETNEQPKGEQPKNATLKVVLDHSYQEQKLREELDKANQTIGALLKQDKEKFDLETERKKIEASMDKKPTNYDPQDTASLLNEPSYQNQHSQVTPMEGSDIDPSRVCGNSVQDVICKVEKLSHVAENANEYKKIQSKLLKKMLHNSKALDLTFTGSNIEFLKHPKQISEFASEQ
jgi:hypothetical protein